MGDTRKKILIDLAIGLVMAFAGMLLMDVFHAQSLRDSFRLLSDCFFLPATLLLAGAGLTWTKNGGVWDGMGFTMKTLFARMKSDYEANRVTFAQYREQREEKNSSPSPSLIAGVVYLVIALVFLVLYNNVK